MIVDQQWGPGALEDDGKNTISSQIVAQLREAVISGELPAGSKINLGHLRERLQVSLSPLREAMARLTADGLVVFEDNRGYHVAPVCLRDFDEIVLLRDQFETFALRESITRGNAVWEGDVVRALHLLNRTERDAARPQTLKTWEAAHRDFHLTLISACEAPLLLRFCGMLLNMHDRYRRIFLSRTSGDRNVMLEHSEIAQAAAARDADYACEKSRDHLARTSTNLRQHLVDSGIR